MPGLRWARPGANPSGDLLEALWREKLPDKAVLVEAVEEALRAGDLRLLHRRDHGRETGRPGGVEQRQRECDQDAARRRRWIGEHIAARVAGAYGLAHPGLVGG